MSVNPAQVGQTEGSHKYHLLNKLKGFIKSKHRNRKFIYGCSFRVIDSVHAIVEKRTLVIFLSFMSMYMLQCKKNDKKLISLMFYLHFS